MRELATEPVRGQLPLFGGLPFGAVMDNRPQLVPISARRVLAYCRDRWRLLVNVRSRAGRFFLVCGGSLPAFHIAVFRQPAARDLLVFVPDAITPADAGFMLEWEAAFGPEHVGVLVAGEFGGKPYAVPAAEYARNPSVAPCPLDMID